MCYYQVGRVFLLHCSVQHVVLVTLITADEQIEPESEPCSRDVLRITVHGIISVNRACNRSNTIIIDDITNKLIGSVLELSSHTYSVIVCSATRTSVTAECVYSIYIAETRNDTTISSSRLTRASMTALQSELTTVSAQQCMHSWI